MSHFTPWLALSAILVCFSVMPCPGDDSLPSAEAILAEWEDSSQKCQSLDANLTVFFYDTFNGMEPNPHQGYAEHATKQVRLL